MGGLGFLLLQKETKLNMETLQGSFSSGGGSACLSVSCLVVFLIRVCFFVWGGLFVSFLSTEFKVFCKLS